ncbi:sugar/pyridoxal phosphate phosphatase YigL [Blochmannia endosymbiont of Polyrhachis (Hedomyrma) turneri]|uniref:sugar/pyridoxal phosphate phosphatase YigL n=1 Tax=Blochmannia endosymbiont of Polyrhachis (Hedomyrma) turneri TaxID=1505596 RepID=UPI00061A6361|nr:sugar/pyridoxal phosphate phosphatase YigL [Blochmannia endosymbiont of Polyrhachis (Hedomyrma) turneri]AKC60134.1 putative hydrolase [Blochmannia endosymbiont of Polyrhachis (Hedomyrma) turneri]
MFAIIASDLDGTLLSPAHNLTDFTKNVLRLLTSSYGVHFIFATGRHHVNVIKIRDSLKIDAYMITSNGSRVHNVLGELILSYDLDPVIAGELLNVVSRDEKILINIFRNDQWFINRDRMDHEHFFREFGFSYEVYQQDELPTDGICKIYFTSADCNRLLVLENLLKHRWGDYINISFSLPMCLEVMPIGVSKGHTLARVVDILGYSLKDCISFGDGMNDREMLAMAGKGCIMGNAHQLLKDTLPFLEVIGSNEDDAVPRYLQSLFLGI